MKNTKLPHLLLLLFLSTSVLNAQDTTVNENNFTLSVSGKNLYIEALLPKDTRQIELHIESSRNDNITRFSTISPYDPDSVSRREKYNRTEKDTWYPVVDIRLENGMEGVCVFKGAPTGNYTFGGPYFDDETSIQKEIVIPSNRLEHWENSLRVGSREIEVDRFYLRRIYPILIREFRHTIELLSEDWSGTVRIYAIDGNEKNELFSKYIAPQKTGWHHRELEAYKGTGFSNERLFASLEALIQDGIRRQNNNPDSPTYGSLHTFYDMEAKLHRTAYWLWGGAPYVKMVVDALQHPEITARFDSTALMESVNRVGKLYLQYLVREKGHPSEGSFLVIWTRKPDGYTKWVGTSDSGIMYKWAILPLYKATGDTAYLEAAKFWSENKQKILKDHEILPHYYLYDEHKFAPSIFDETGWDPEGHDALYQITGEEAHRQVAKEYMTKHMDKFQNENGLWNRTYNIPQEKANPPARMTRGTGWAMEGLLAMNNMFPDTIYLEYAKKMGNHLVEHQNPDGSWYFVFDAEEGSKYAIPTDKGTPLWSLLLYRLYKATGEEKYLQSARNALTWCLENQYTGPDPEAIGGLIGRTNASMVGYRYFYDATCAYSTGFFGLAILEELKLNSQNQITEQ